MTEVVIVSAARTAVGRGKADGGLAAMHPVDVSSAVMKAAIDRAGIDPAIIEDVQWGCAMPEASQGLNHARLAWLRGGFPVSTAAATINRFCSSGLQSVAYAAQAVIAGQGDAVMAGGIEMMSQVPMSGYNARLSPEITESYIGMGFTAERVAKRWEITREQQDQFAYDSQRKAVAALASGVFAKEIVPITTPRYSWKGAEKTVKDVVFEVDECPRAETTMEGLAKLRPAFVPTGSVTAGNASPYSDGAAAVLVMSADKAKELGLTPLARFVSFAVAGVEPDIMGVGPIKAVPKALKRAGLTLADLKLIEFNEAFAAQALAVIKELDMPTDIINVNGGAIALGHPLGATGAKLTTQLLHELHRRGGGYGMVTMCIGGGMGAAGIFEVY
ncbi:MAG TPA: thiolase family protein [Gemmatimonas sp.]|uniref:thiolase family protein n=1 Tax=Gemmatimonas sp. TaxID=1962908 RepID=UPI002ED77BCE